MTVLKTGKNSDRRRENRRDYSGFIFFATENHVHEGVLKNFSRFGLHIISDIGVKVGDCITIALPYMDDKRIGQVVWRNGGGFGVKLGGNPDIGVSPSRLYQRISSRVIRLFRTSA